MWFASGLSWTLWFCLSLETGGQWEQPLEPDTVFQRKVIRGTDTCPPPVEVTMSYVTKRLAVIWKEFTLLLWAFSYHHCLRKTSPSCCDFLPVNNLLLTWILCLNIGLDIPISISSASTHVLSVHIWSPLDKFQHKSSMYARKFKLCSLEIQVLRPAVGFLEFYWVTLTISLGTVIYI